MRLRCKCCGWLWDTPEQYDDHIAAMRLQQKDGTR